MLGVSMLLVLALGYGVSYWLWRNKHPVCGYFVAFAVPVALIWFYSLMLRGGPPRPGTGALSVEELVATYRRAHEMHDPLVLHDVDLITACRASWATPSTTLNGILAELFKFDLEAVRLVEMPKVYRRYGRVSYWYRGPFGKSSGYAQGGDYLHGKLIVIVRRPTGELVEVDPGFAVDEVGGRFYFNIHDLAADDAAVALRRGVRPKCRPVPLGLDEMTSLQFGDKDWPEKERMLDALERPGTGAAHEDDLLRAYREAHALKDPNLLSHLELTLMIQPVTVPTSEQVKRVLQSLFEFGLIDCRLEAAPPNPELQILFGYVHPDENGRPDSEVYYWGDFAGKLLVAVRQPNEAEPKWVDPGLAVVRFQGRRYLKVLVPVTQDAVSAVADGVPPKYRALPWLEQGSPAFVEILRAPTWAEAVRRIDELDRFGKRKANR
jgi:hypothetical protein